jgi:DNA-binding PadR family transcriptional regulator
LEKQGWLSSEWGISPNNQRAKFYRLTAVGKRRLAAEESNWELLVKAITGVMQQGEV